MLYCDLVDSRGQVYREWFEYRKKGYGSYDVVARLALRRHKGKSLKVHDIGSVYQLPSKWEYTPPEGYVPDNVKHTKFAFGRKYKKHVPQDTNFDNE